MGFVVKNKLHNSLYNNISLHKSISVLVKTRVKWIFIRHSNWFFCFSQIDRIFLVTFVFSFVSKTITYRCRFENVLRFRRIKTDLGRDLFTANTIIPT